MELAYQALSHRRRLNSVFRIFQPDSVGFHRATISSTQWISSVRDGFHCENDVFTSRFAFNITFNFPLSIFNLFNIMFEASSVFGASLIIFKKNRGSAFADCALIRCYCRVYSLSALLCRKPHRKPHIGKTQPLFRHRVFDGSGVRFEEKRAYYRQ